MIYICICLNNDLHLHMFNSKKDNKMNMEFVKKQQNRIIELVGEITTIVVVEQLKPEGAKWELCLNNSMAGNYLSLRIIASNNKECETVEKAEIWGLDRILNTSYSFSNLKQTDFQKRVTSWLKEIRKIKTLAQKYAALNEKHARR